jgi:hypothetical protein
MRLGHFFLAIDVEALCELSSFKQTAGEFLGYLRGSAKDPKGPGRIWTGIYELHCCMYACILIAGIV